MGTYNGRSYTGVKSLALKGQGTSRGGILRFVGTNSSNPLGSTANGLYVNSSNELVYVAQGVSTILGAAGSGTGVPTFEQLFGNDQTMSLNGTTFTINNTSGNNDVLTLTNSGAGSGDVLQITNVGTGKDIQGTSDTWSVTKLGAAAFAAGVTVSGTGGSNMLTITAGDVSIADGSITMIDADNAATLSVTNDTATTASVIVIAGSGTFTGNTTSSFMTITPSGLTTGTAVYLPVAALTTGKGVHIVGNALTTGNLIAVTSTATAITGNGRLFLSSHSGATGTSATLNEFSSAAGDETIVLAVTASGALALGNILKVSGSSMTTGTAINAGDLDALTTGIGLSVASTSTGVTTGSLIRVSTATTGAVATNGIVSIRATGAYTSTSNVGLVDVVASATTAGTVMRIASTAAGQTATELLRVIASGFTTGYTGNVALFQSSSTTGASNVVSIVAANTTAGNALKVTADSLTTGTGVLVTSSGTITSSGEGLVNIVASGATTGYGLKIDMTEGTLTTGKYINCYDDTGTVSVFSVGKTGTVLSRDFTEVVTGTNVITASESGSVYFLNAATEFVSTLPAPAAGLHFTFIVSAAPSGASYTITTNSSSNIIKGTVHSSTGGNADSDTGCDTITFADGVAVAGDMAIVWCDGTNWFAKCFCDADAGITFDTAS